MSLAICILVVEPFVLMFFEAATKTQVSYLLFCQKARMLWCSSSSTLQVLSLCSCQEPENSCFQEDLISSLKSS
jgi:hypothetical protein